MDEPTANAIGRRFGLGPSLGPPERVDGGLIHRMHRLRFPDGDFAVKTLNPAILARPGIRDAYARSERIAARIADAGLPAVAALERDGETVHEFGAFTVLVYPWIVDGAIIESGTRAQAERIGGILGRIHTLRLDIPDLPPPEPQHAFEDWAMRTDAAEAQRKPWANELRDALPEIEAWSRRTGEAVRALAGTERVSHRDVHAQNVLWTENGVRPWLIDWESAGLEMPAKEAIVTAFEWSGLIGGTPDLALFRAVLDGYRDAAPLSADAARLGLHACFENWLGWMHFNLLRAVGFVSDDAEERTLGERQTTGTLATLRRAESQLPALTEIVADF